jgi:hypothetical protein
MAMSNLSQSEASGVGGLPGVPCSRCGNHHRGECRQLPAQSEAERKRHRVEMIDTEINVLGQMWQRPGMSDGQSHLLVKQTTKLLAERGELVAEVGEPDV